MERPHIAYIDPLRLLACLSVVFMHTAADGLSYQVAQRPGWYALAAVSSFAFSAVPLFFMISGYLLTDSPKTCDVGVLVKLRLLFAFWTPLSFLSVIACSAAVFALSMLFAWCLSRIPVLSYLNCGIVRKKQEAPQDA